LLTDILNFRDIVLMNGIQSGSCFRIRTLGGAYLEEGIAHWILLL